MNLVPVKLAREKSRVRDVVCTLFLQDILYNLPGKPYGIRAVPLGALGEAA